MKKFIGVLVFSFITTTLFAQAVSDQDWLLSGGLMVGNHSTIPTINAERVLRNNFSIGAKLFRISSKDDLFGDKIHLTYVGMVGNYHFAEVLNVANDRLDPYAGLGLGIGVVSYDGESETSPALLSLNAGTRYFFSDKLGGYGQVSLGLSEGFGSYLEFGLTYKLRK